MAARYTTGKKWADVSEQATALADKLEQAALQFHELADADASAYADLQRTWKEKLPAEEVNAIETRARQVPLDVLNLCADCSQNLHDFMGSCNPNIISDVLVGIQLLNGAAAGAWHTLLVNNPDEDLTAQAQARLGDCRMIAEVALGYKR